VTYIYLEPVILIMLEFVPGIYIISMALKLKFLSTSNSWHLLAYEKTFGHLQEFDIFHIAWHHSSDKIVLLAVKMLELLDHLYPRLSVSQLDLLTDSLEDAGFRVKQAKNSKAERQTMRMSRLLNRSALDNFTKSRRGSFADLDKSELVNETSHKK
jgi:hypothetical protein